MEILVDVNGSDNGIGPSIDGTVESMDKVSSKLILVGDGEKIEEYIDNKYPREKEKILNRIGILNAKDVITNNDEPAFAIKNKKESSIVKAYDYMKENDNTLFLSAGSTGAVMAGGLLKLKRINGVHRPALITILPTDNDRGVILLDCGANVETGDLSIVQYAQMGLIYAKEVQKKEKIKVGLLNIGTEAEKGTTELKGFNRILRERVPEFVGNVESREILSGSVDVIVAHGLMGNIALKALEGTARTMKNALISGMKKNIFNMFKAVICKSMIEKALLKYDYTRYGGAVLLGVRKPVIKIHGNAKTRNYRIAILQGEEILKNDLIEVITKDIENSRNEDLQK